MVSPAFPEAVDPPGLPAPGIDSKPPVDCSIPRTVVVM